MDERSAEERRTELLQAKDELIQVMREVIGPINQITCRLVAEADGLINDVFKEKAKTPRTRAVRYGNEAPAQSDTMRGTAPPKLAKGKRACSICRQPGHRASTCPQGKGAFENL